jgi:hypothetical protein
VVTTHFPKSCCPKPEKRTCDVFNTKRTSFQDRSPPNQKALKTNFSNQAGILCHLHLRTWAGVFTCVCVGVVAVFFPLFFFVAPSSLPSSLPHLPPFLLVPFSDQAIDTAPSLPPFLFFMNCPSRVLQPHDCQQPTQNAPLSPSIQLLLLAAVSTSLA